MRGDETMPDPKDATKPPEVDMTNRIRKGAGPYEPSAGEIATGKSAPEKFSSVFWKEFKDIFSGKFLGYLAALFSIATVFFLLSFGFITLVKWMLF